MKLTTWAAIFVKARGQLTQAEAAALLCNCPVSTVRDWEQGRHSPAPWVQSLVVGHLMRHEIKPPRRRPGKQVSP